MAANALPLRASLEGKAVRALVSDHRCNLGSVTGTGSSITIKSPNATITKLHQLVVISPCGVLKERIVPEGIYALFGSRSVLSTPSLKRYPLKPPRCMNSVPLFSKAGCYQCLHDAAFSYSPLGSPKQIQHKERHQSASVQAGLLNGNNDPQPSIRCIVLDVEGTTTPITYVTDILFPYARDNVRKHLMSTYDSEETQEDIKLLRAQVEDDLEKGVPGAVPVPPDDVGKQEVIDSLVTNVEAMIKADRKITSLKQLQGHIWRTGFENKELQGVVYEDVPEALQKWHANGIKVYIYSSGSREAQRLIYGNTSYGDLRKYLCGFFDTTVGNKRESRSYFEISQSVGVDKPSEILFITDVYQEAMAAKAAGLEVLISIRPGNAPLPENHGFRTIKSFAEI